MVKEPTQLDEALLGHVYVHKLFLSKNWNAVVKNIYFSDHDVDKLQILVGGNDKIHFERTMKHYSKTHFEVRNSKLQITFLG